MKKSIFRRLTVCAALCVLMLLVCPALAETKCPHNEWAEVCPPIDPTCTQPGMSRIRRCVDCGEIRGGEVIPARGHNPDGGWEIRRAATCAEEGQQGHRCMNCGAWVEIKPIARPSYHTDPGGNRIELDQIIILPGTPATCTEPGVKPICQCPTCGLIKGGEETAPLGHDLIGAEWTVLREATCVTDGEKVRRCLNCNKIMQRQTVRSTGAHAAEYYLNDPSCIAVPAQEPTCNRPGYTAVYQCPVCGETKGGERRDPHHVWGEWQQVTAGSCTEQGLQRRVCGACGKTEEKSSGYAHQLGEIEIVTPATCTQEGVGDAVCAVCGAYQTVQIPARGHDFGEAQVIQSPTCVGMGQMGRVCAACGQVKKENMIPATGEHTFETVIAGQEPTCTQPGAVGLLRCSVCGEEEGTDDVIPALGHKGGGWEEEYPPTCGEPGRTRRICVRCGAVLETKTIPASGAHSWQLMEEGTQPTCVAGGVSDKLICQVCGLMKGGDALEALGHDDKGAAWEVRRPATCAQDGIKARRCPRCGETLEEKGISKPSYHTDNAGNRCDPVLIAAETSPTCTQPGVKARYQCATCGAVIGGEEIPAGHVWGEWTVVSGGTCVQPSQRRRVCDVCGQEQTDTALIGHRWAESTIEPQCETEGKRRLTCSVCGMQDVQILPALGHDFSGEAEIIMPTCGQEGSVALRCLRCGKRNLLQKLSSTGQHVWSYALRVQATCTTDGVRIRRCEICGQQQEPEVIPAYGHVLFGSEWTIKRQPTCASEGQMGRACQNCGIWVETRPVEKLTNHEWSLVMEGQPATCTKNGNKPLRECAVCGTVKGGETIPAAGHVMRLADVVYPTCTEAGSKIFACAVCGTLESESLPSEHAWGKWEDAPNDASLERHLCLACGEEETRQKPVCAHPSIRTEVVFDATCTEAGRTKRVCTVCGVVIDQKPIPALGHTYTGGQYAVTLAPTCVEDGAGALICDRCGYRDAVRTMAATGIHIWDIEAEAVAATCTEAGAGKILKCSGCGMEKGGEAVKALGHDFGTGWTYVTAPTCVTGGVQERVCARCGARETQNVPATGEHNWQTVQEAQQPTCTVAGKTAVMSCSVCNARKGGETLTAQHTWGNWVNVGDPGTCTEPGLRRRTCKVCGETQEQPVYNHFWTVTSKTPPTCGAAGTTVMMCSICGMTDTKTMEATGWHNYTQESLEPTCATNGYLRMICEACGDVSFSYPIPATGMHQKVVYEEGVPATCTTPGVKPRYQCMVCGMLDENPAEIPARGHDTKGTPWEYTVMPTCEKAGRLVRRCAYCGKAVEQMEAPARGHSWIVVGLGAAPTCTKAGVSGEENCPDCGAARGGEALPALGHDIAVQVIAAPTASADGSERRYCTRCDLSKTRVLPATGYVLNLPALLTEVDEEAFANTGVRSVVIPDTVTAIRKKAFANCTALAAVRMPDSVIQIAEDAFDQCGIVWFLCESDNDAAQYARDHHIEYIIDQ